jgi:DNA helicase-2/ATP-dependent DNA helicase PcrA
MTADQFPSRTDTSDSWVKDPGAVPVDLRTTDREELPQLRLPVPGSGDQAAVRAALEDYVEEWKRFGESEEIRLGYVAVTPRQAPAAVLGQLVARGREAERPVGCCSTRSAARAPPVPASSSRGPNGPEEGAPNPRSRSGRSACGRPTRSRRRAAVRSPPPPSWWPAPPPHPLDCRRRRSAPATPT